MGDVSKYVFTFDGNSPNDIKKSLRNNKLWNGTQLLIKHFWVQITVQVIKSETGTTWCYSSTLFILTGISIEACPDTKNTDF